MAFTSAATIIVAQTFVLVDPNGIIVAQFDSGGPTNAPSLSFQNYDALTSDSRLYWTEVTGQGGGTPGHESIALTGPRLESSSAFDPFITIGVDAPSAEQKFISIADANAIFIETTNSVDNPQTEIDLFGNAERMDIFARTIRLNNDTVTKFDYSTATAQGQVYGVTFHQAILGGNVVTTGANQTLITVNIPIALVAGAMAVTTFTIGANSAVAGAFQIALMVDGVVVVAGPYATQPAGEDFSISHTYNLPIASGAAHTVSGVINGGAGFDTALGGRCFLNVVYYR